MFPLAGVIFTHDDNVQMMVMLRSGTKGSLLNVWYFVSISWNKTVTELVEEATGTVII